MAKIVSNKRAAMFDEELDVKELGAETEAEKQMKVILDKQLKTSISLSEQFSQHRTFTSPSTFNSLTELVHGTCSLKKFRQIEENEDLRQELQRCGLSEGEIIEYLSLKSEKRDEKRIVNPAIKEEILMRIEEKIKLHNNELLKPEEFKNVKKLTRHEMEIENTLYVGCSNKNKLPTLVSVNEVLDKDGAFTYIKSLSDKLLQKCKKNKKRKKEKFLHESNSTLSDVVDFQYDPNIHHAIVPLDEIEVKEKQLSVEEIRKLSRFEQYNMGQPSKTLYLKNLHNKTTLHELQSIFGKFEEENGYPISYKLCTGRMRGQAFITFSSSSVSEKALNFANGYILREKPIIIIFGRQT